jgi:hypothetical protein
LSAVDDAGEGWLPRDVVGDGFFVQCVGVGVVIVNTGADRVAGGQRLTKAVVGILFPQKSFTRCHHRSQPRYNHQRRNPC